MKEYTIIGNFNFENNKYALLIDDDKKYFFLKIKEDGNYEYITLKELIKLTKLFSYNENIRLIEQEIKKSKKIKLKPKILIGTIAVTLSLSIGGLIRSSNEYVFDLSQPNTSNTQFEQIISTVDPSEEKDATQEAIDKLLADIKKQNENFQVEDKVDCLHLTIILDSSKLDETLGYPKEEITYDTIRQLINNNSNIPTKYKELYITLVNNLEREYPEMDLRVWYENLKTIKIVELEEMDMKLKAVSVNAYACYRIDENIIYTVKDYEYEPGTWEYQVIMHEFCHPIRSAMLKKGNEEIRIQFQTRSGQGTIIDEAMNSLLSLRSYDKDEKDIAYQLQSNMIEIMVDSMDYYTYQDYVEHNITYFENELNKENNDDRAVEIIGLIDLQYKDYHDDKISVDQEVFYPLYDYLANMYYSKRINNNMSYEQAQIIHNEFISRLTYDVPEEYNLDINHMNEYFNNYCEQLGITPSIQK